jgi:ADP-ribose pyrophosphatase YjhB (NUDIX family)
VSAGADTLAFMTERVARRAARLLILDPDGSVFLQLHDDVEIGLHWAPPGGGLEEGETELAAALRETREETGWTDVKTGPALCRWEHDYTRDGVPTRQSDIYFLAAGPRAEPEAAARATYAEEGILAIRWWTPGALGASLAAFWPPNLPALLASVRRDGPPHEVIELGYTPTPSAPGGRAGSARSVGEPGDSGSED